MEAAMMRGKATLKTMLVLAGAAAFLSACAADHGLRLIPVRLWLSGLPGPALWLPGLWLFRLRLLGRRLASRLGPRPLAWASLMLVKPWREIRQSRSQTHDDLARPGAPPGRTQPFAHRLSHAVGKDGDLQPLPDQARNGGDRQVGTKEAPPWPGSVEAPAPQLEANGNGEVLAAFSPSTPEVVLTGWTRIGLIGPEMAQKRSSPFLYRWPSWSARGELARIAALGPSGGSGSAPADQSMSTPKQGRARE